MRLSLLLTLLTLTAWTAQAQIELSTNNAPGHVGIGVVPETNSQLKVRNTDVGDANQRSFGIKGEAYPGTSASTAIGVRGLASEAYNSTGVGGEASSAAYNIGVSGYTFGTSGQTSYGIRGHADGSGIRYAGYFVGDVYVSGNLFSSNGGSGGPQPLSMTADASMTDASASESDERAEAASLLSGLGTFRYSTAGPDGAEMERFGINAAALAEVLPGFVRAERHLSFPEGPDGPTEEIVIESVDYVSLVPVLVQAVSEQQSEIEALRAEIAQLRDLIEGIGIGR